MSANPGPGVPLDRRALLGLLVGAAGASALAGCSASGSGTRASTTTPASTATTAPAGGVSPTPSATAAPQDLPHTTAWVARAGEVDPAVKARATALVEAVASWPVGGAGLAAARARVAALGLDPALADECAPLLGTEPEASCQVVDAQYGGILTGSSSVLVVLDQWRRHADGTVHAGGTTLDVRLVAATPRWRVTEVHPARPGAAGSSPPATAGSVLASPRIRLPYAARADVATGTIATSVLRTLLRLADSHLVDVSVVRSGHPLLVFGTNRPSDHPRGHAVDVWALDGRALVEHANHPLAVSGMRLAVAQGAYNVGGPVQLSGPQYFSDRTHQDHIHLGFRG